MSEYQKKIIIDLLNSKKEEILNFDMDEIWALETIDAIELFISEIN